MTVGCSEGFFSGWSEGRTIGENEGCLVGCKVGFAVSCVKVVKLAHLMVEKRVDL